MSAQRSEDGKKVIRRPGRNISKPTLMNSYAAVNDEDLQSIVGKIRSITRSAAARSAPSADDEPEANPGPATVDRTVDQPMYRPSGQSVRQSTKWPNDRSNDKTLGLSNDKTIDTPDATDSRPSTPKTIVFNHNQAILYQCIYWLQGQTTTLQRIGQVTGISAFTLKHCLKKLQQVEAIEYHGRRNTAGYMGFSATALPCAMVLRGEEHLLLQRLDDIKFDRLPIARAIDPAKTVIGNLTDPMNGPMTRPIDDHSGASNSSSKKQLLQGLLLEDAFQSLNVQSLLPYLDAIDSIEELQDFLDMVNACVAASRRTESPIRNPKGFLIAQLKAGYINPPEGYKSRRLRAQEERNRQLEAELEEMRRLKAEEEELELKVFRAKLSPSACRRLDQEARGRVNPRSPLSEARQVEMAETEILRDWLKTGQAEGDGASAF